MKTLVDELFLVVFFSLSSGLETINLPLCTEEQNSSSWILLGTVVLQKYSTSGPLSHYKNRNAGLDGPISSDLSKFHSLMKVLQEDNCPGGS